MPSFRSCLTSLAFLAFTIAPVVSAKSHGNGAAIVARNAHPIARSVGSSAAGLEKRVTSKKRLAAKSAAAKRAAARKAAKKAALAAPVAAKSVDPYAVGSVFQSSVVALAVANKKCSQDKNCNSVPLIANSYAICMPGSRRCSLRCNTGFFPGGADGQQCISGDSSCPNEPSCPVVSQGYTTCNAAGFCQLQCNAAYGLSLHQNSATGAYSCISLQSDALNCGTSGNVCPPSYNGIGNPVCRVGQCGLRCTGGTFQYTTGSADRPFLCK